MSVTDKTPSAPRVVAVAADLIFGARIRAAAEAAGVAVDFARSADALHALAAGASLVLLDLDARWVDPEVTVKTVKGATGVPVVAFVSHVREDAIATARAAGADRVLARSGFVRELPGLLEGL